MGFNIYIGNISLNYVRQEPSVAFYKTSTFFHNSPGTLHLLYGPQNKNESAPRWWDRVTDVWAKVRGYFIAGCATF